MQSSEKVILVFRFSAMGDVAMTVPVLRQIVELNPDQHFVMISDQRFECLFQEIKGLKFEGFDLKAHYKGFFGILRIFRYLNNKYNVDAIVDLHDVLRTRLLRNLFKLFQKRICVIEKGRAVKHALTRKNGKNLIALPHTVQRYLDCFKLLNIQIDQALLNQPLIDRKPSVSDIRKIGFAPFAKHSNKIFPLEKMYEVVAHFDREGYMLYFFGSGEFEKQVLNDWETKTIHVLINQTSLSLSEELQLISTLDLMVTMDSANMHLASNMNVPVVSVWGPTHPYAGFYGFRQHPNNIVQLDLPCRPCSVYGNKPCWRGDHACMREIKPKDIIAKMEALLN